MIYKKACWDFPWADSQEYLFFIFFLISFLKSMFLLIKVKSVNLTELDSPPVAISVFVQYAKYTEV